MEPRNNQDLWQPLERIQRRVAGVLVEKAKTTPDNYPMTINAIVTAANQKSNRHPKMELDADDVEQALDELRELKAVVEIQGDGRKYKYKHLLYDWLGVDKVELAVMAELLLRGEQTLGDLRARSSRMENIESQSTLKPIVHSLIERNLIVPLTQAGRGQIVTHNLYRTEELEKIRRSVGTGEDSEHPSDEKTPVDVVLANAGAGDTGTTESMAELQKKIEKMAAKIAELDSRIEKLESD